MWEGISFYMSDNTAGQRNKGPKNIFGYVFLCRHCIFMPLEFK